MMYQNLTPKVGGVNLSQEVKPQGPDKSPHDYTWLQSYQDRHIVTDCHGSQ